MSAKMIIAEYSENTKASAKAIWQKWTDVSSWKNLDQEIIFSDLDGPFTEKTIGMLKYTDGKTKIFMIEQVDHLKKFVDVSRMKFCEFKTHYNIKKIGNKTQITHKAELTGPLSFFYSLIIKRKITNKMKIVVKRLIKIVEHENQIKKKIKL